MRAAETVGPAVVRVETRRAQGEGTGLGFVIAQDGLLLTNAHAAAGVRELRVSLIDGEETIMV